MPTSVISNVVTDPNGVAVADCPVIIRLQPAGSFRITDDSEIAPVVETITDDTGLWSIALEETSNITPANSYYEVEERIPAHRGGARKYTFEVGAASASLLASLVSIIPGLPANTYISLATGDARYLIGPASFGGAGDITTVNPDDAASAGTVDSYSRIDHQHAAPAGTPGSIEPDDAAAEGSSTSFARADHKHAIAAGTPTGVTVGTAAEGSSTSFTRADHVHPMPSAGLIITGTPSGYSTANLVLGPVDGTDEGGQITLVGGPNGASTDHPDWNIDVYQDQFRVHTAGVVKLQYDESTEIFTITGDTVSGGFVGLAGSSTYRVVLISNQSGNPFATNAPVLVGESGWAFYHNGAAAYKMGWRGTASPYSTNYLWADGNTLFGSAPNDGSITNNHNFIGTLRSSGTFTSGSLVVAASQVQSQLNTSGSAEWSNANLLCNPGAGNTAVAWHPGGVAPQVRVGNGNNNMYFRNSNDSAYVTILAVISDQSSGTTKQDIEDWPPLPAASAPGQAIAALRSKRPALDKVHQIKPKFFRRNHDEWMHQIRYDGEEDGPHECGRDCDYTPEAPCPRYRDWELGSVGVIAEELYESFPEAVMLDNEGRPAGVSPTALAIAAIAAIQELRTEIEELRGNSPRTPA